MSQDKHTKNRGKPKGPHDDLTVVAERCKLFLKTAENSHMNENIIEVLQTFIGMTIISLLQ